MKIKAFFIGAAALALAGCGAYTPVRDMHPNDPLEKGNGVSWEFEYIGAAQPINMDATSQPVSWEYDFNG